MAPTMRAAIMASVVGIASSILVHRADVPSLPAGVILNTGDVVPVNWMEFETRTAAMFAEVGAQLGAIYPVLNLVSTPKGNRLTAIVAGKPRVMAINDEDVAKLDNGEMLDLAALGVKYEFDPVAWGAAPSAAIARLPAAPALGRPVPGHDHGEGEVGVHHGDSAEDEHVGGEEGPGPAHAAEAKGPGEDEYDDIDVHEGEMGHDESAFVPPPEDGFLSEDGSTPEGQDGVQAGEMPAYELPGNVGHETPVGARFPGPMRGANPTPA